MEAGVEPGVQNERRCGEKWNVWHHGGNGDWENHVASCASYGVFVNGFTWEFADYDARVEHGTVSEEPQIVCGPVSPYETSRYVWEPAAMGVAGSVEDEFALSQKSMSSCLGAADERSPNQEDKAGKTSRNSGNGTSIGAT